MKRRHALSAVVLTCALVLAACGGDDGASSGDDGGGGGGGGSASGTVNVSGSSTVAPISTSVAEKLEDDGSEIVVNVDGPGTGDGFELFCQGDTDISDASRPIKAEEAEACEANGIEYIELKVALDGLAVITNPNNDGVECLSFADLYALTGPESQGFSDWSDAQDLAAELGSDTEFPDASLDITAPGEESGTYDSYVEIALDGIAGDRVESGDLDEADEGTTRPDYQSSADDNVILQGIQGSDTSLGWVGLSYVLESDGAVQALAISEEPGGDCVEPTEDTVADGSYPIARPLYIYVSAESAESNEAVAEYVDFYLTDEGIASVTDVDYVAIPADELDEQRQVWEDRTTGTREA